MNLLSAIRIALDALLGNKTRTGLTSLGIVIGISAVIALVSAGEGSRSKLHERLGSLGKNLLVIRPGSPTPQGMISDFAPLANAAPDATRHRPTPRPAGVGPPQWTQR